MTYLRQWHVPGDGDDLASFDAACEWLDSQITLGRLARVGRTEPVTAEILAAITDPLGLAGAQLPAYGVPAAGCCRECLRPPVFSQGLCVYCEELTRARGEVCGCEHGPGFECLICHRPRGDLDRARIVLCVLLLIVGALTLLWAAGAVT